MWLWVEPALAAAPTADQVVAKVEEAAAYRKDRVAQAVPVISEAEYRRAAAGETVTGLLQVDGVSARKAYGVAVLDVDIATLWAGINDETAHPGYTATAYSELVAGKICESDRRILQFLPIPLITDRWWITILKGNSTIAANSGGKVRELSWTSSVDAKEITSAAGIAQIAKGMPLAWTKGGWFFIALDSQHTLLEYYVWSDPGGNVPAGVASMFASGGVSDAIAAMGKFAKSGKSRCPVS